MQEFALKNGCGLLELATDDPPQIRHAIGELFYDYVIGQKLYTSQSGTIGFSLI